MGAALDEVAGLHQEVVWPVCDTDGSCLNSCRTYSQDRSASRKFMNFLVMFGPPSCLSAVCNIDGVHFFN
jgi:hypothetical protein